jgi:hypothetical protein
MTQLQDLATQAPTLGRVREMAHIGHRAIIGFGIVVLIGILAVSILFGIGVGQQVGTTTTGAAADVTDGWFPAVSAANHEQSMAEAAATVDGWASAVLRPQSPVVDGWSSALLRPEALVVDGWASRYLVRDE